MSRPHPHKPLPSEQRIVKLLLPLPLIRAMDRLLVEGVGGLTTRNEFAREALESYILELTHEPAPEEPAVLARQGRGRLSVAETRAEASEPELFHLASNAEELVPALGLETTAFDPLPHGLAVLEGEAQVIAEPLFGMHNRDYPSLWVARRLADYLGNGPIGFDEFSERATDEAWAFAEALKPLERELGLKLTALFPTNHEKRQTATTAFRAFAIGSVTADGEAIYAEGPLFLWRVIDVARVDGEVTVGLTEHGRKLLSDLTGLTVEPPHAPESARIFLAHLRDHAPADWWGFERALAIVAERPTRAELIEGFRAAQPRWRQSVAATNAQGYVARAREWGLIAPKVVDGHYELIELGAELAEGEE